MEFGDKTEIYTSVWTVHHDARYFDRPYDFLPQRWLDPTSHDVKEATQPFSVGPRGCIGRKYVSCSISRMHCSFSAFHMMLLTVPFLG